MVLSAHSTPRIWNPIFVEAFKALRVPSQTKTGIRFWVTSHILWVFEAHRKATISCLENWTTFLLACAEPWLKPPLPLCQSGADAKWYFSKWKNFHNMLGKKWEERPCLWVDIQNFLGDEPMLQDAKSTDMT